MVNLHFYWIP